MSQLVDLIVGALIAVSNRALLVFLVLAVIVAIAIVVMWVA